MVNQEQSTTHSEPSNRKSEVTVDNTKIVEKANTFHLLKAFLTDPLAFPKLLVGMGSEPGEKVLALFDENPAYVEVVLRSMIIHIIADRELMLAAAPVIERGNTATELSPLIGKTTGAEGKDWRAAHNTTEKALNTKAVGEFLVIAHQKMNAAVESWVAMLDKNQEVAILPNVQEVFLDIVPETLVTIAMPDKLKELLAWSIREALFGEIILRKTLGHPTFLQSLDQAFVITSGKSKELLKIAGIMPMVGSIVNQEIVEGLNETHRELSSLVLDVVFQTIHPQPNTENATAAHGTNQTPDFGLASQYLALYLKNEELTIEDLQSVLGAATNKESLRAFLLSEKFKENPKYEKIVKVLSNLMAELRGIYNAAFETTSSVMSSLTWYLAQDPEYYSLIQKEVQAFDEKYGYDHVPTHEQLSRELPFVAAAVMSATNLQPPLGAQARTVIKDRTIKGKQPNGEAYEINLKKNESVILQLKQANRQLHPSWNPYAYLQQDAEGNYHLNVESFKQFALHETTSFSADRHFCLGFELAMGEEMLFLMAMARRLPRLTLSESKQNAAKRTKSNKKAIGEPSMSRGITDQLKGDVAISPLSLIR